MSREYLAGFKLNLINMNILHIPLNRYLPKNKPPTRYPKQFPAVIIIINGACPVYDMPNSPMYALVLMKLATRVPIIRRVGEFLPAT